MFYSRKYASKKLKNFTTDLTWFRLSKCKARKTNSVSVITPTIVKQSKMTRSDLQLFHQSRKENVETKNSSDEYVLTRRPSLGTSIVANAIHRSPTIESLESSENMSIIYRDVIADVH